MSKSKALIIVESPAKIKTLKKFLGNEYLFASSFGHVRDLPQKGFGIDIENNFEPQYEILPDKKKVIAELKKLAKQSDVVYLSPDPDREGEAIAWHIAAILPEKTIIKRTAFNAITKEAVFNAIKDPHDIDIDLVNAQQARRLLDRIVGYKISPILGRKLQRRSGLSAGRVQSVALKLVVDREKEIERFKPCEYWNIGAFLKGDDSQKPFFAKLYAIDDKKVEKEPIEGKEVALIQNEEMATTIVKRL
jgi:DNA topoisomerase I